MLQHGKQQTIQPGNKRETEISVRGVSAWVSRETRVAYFHRLRREYDARGHKNMQKKTEASLETVRKCTFYQEGRGLK